MKADINGFTMNYELSGPEDAPVVTLSNSLLSNLRMWDLQMDALSEYRVIRYDQRGHGDSEATGGEYDFELLAEDARCLLEHLSVERTHFIGLSMGGMTGQALALYHPELIQSLVLADTRGHTPEVRKPMRAERIKTVRREGIEPMVEGCIAGWFSEGFAAANPDLMDEVRAMVRSTKPLGLIGCTYAIDTHNYTPRLSEITCPTLIVVGEDDQGTPVSESEAMQKLIPGSDLVILAEARHLSNMERPAEFNEAIVAFLAQHAQ